MFDIARDHEHARREGGAWVLPSCGSLSLRIAGNGSYQVVWCCSRCTFVSSPVPHDLVPSGIEVGGLPVIADFRGSFARCCVAGCESDDVELNHFGPRAIFGPEAERWPQGYLCRRHHREWSERVTPQLNPPAQARQ